MKRRKRYKKIVVWAGLIIALLTGMYVAVNVAGGSSVGDSFAFLWRFVCNPLRMGAIAPSSKVLAQASVAHLPELQRPRRILEVGAGTGVVTAQIVASMHDGDLLDAIELDSDLVPLLRANVGGAAGVQVHQGSILDWTPGYQYDAIISGIPFKSMPLQVVKDIFAKYHELLLPGGVCSYYSYILLPAVKQALLWGEDEKNFKAVRDFLNEEQRQYGVAEEIVYANLPPAAVITMRF